MQNNKVATGRRIGNAIKKGEIIMLRRFVYFWVGILIFGVIVGCGSSKKPVSVNKDVAAQRSKPVESQITPEMCLAINEKSLGYSRAFGNFLTVSGVAINVTANASVTAVQIKILGFDKDGGTIYEETQYITGSEVIGANAKKAFRLVLRNAQKVKKVQLRVYKCVFADKSTSPEKTIFLNEAKKMINKTTTINIKNFDECVNLSDVKFKATFRNSMYKHISCVITNTDDKAIVRGMKLRVTRYNKNGGVINSDEILANGTLNPGESKHFDLNLKKENNELGVYNYKVLISKGNISCNFE